MTNPGGYCNPDGQGGYEDADWVRGYNEYHAQCAGTQPASPTPTRTLVGTNTPAPATPTPTWTLVGTNTPAAATPTRTLVGTNTPAPTSTQSCVQQCVAGGGLVPECNQMCAAPSPTRTLVGTNTPIPATATPRPPTATPTPKCCFSHDNDPVTGCPINFECTGYSQCNSGLACLPATGITGTPTPTPLPIATRTPTPTNTPPPSPTPTPILCQIIEQNSLDHSKKYDLVVLPDGYDSLTTFGTDAREAIQKFQNSNLGSLLKKFNFYYYNSLSIPLNIVRVCRDGVPCWDKTAANLAKRNCHGDGYLIISHMSKKSENASAFESEWKSWNYVMGFGTGYGSGEALVLRAFLYQTPHELGHVIGQAGDAYDKLVTMPADMTSLWYNCSEQYSGSPTAACPKWQSDGIAAGCYKGCSASNWYSPSEKSYMDLILLGEESNFYDIPTKRLWEKSLGGFPN